MRFRYRKYTIAQGVEKLKTRIAVVVSVTGLAIAGGGGLSFALLSAAHADTATGTVVVTPTNTQGWYSADTRPGGAINYVEDATSPLPDGALQLTTDSTNASKAQYLKDVNVPLSSVTSLSYATKQVAGAAVADPSFQLVVDTNSDGQADTTLVYEPYWNGTVEQGVWQNWDVAAGQFWSSKTVDPLLTAGAGGPPLYTLDQVEAAYPNAVLLSIGVNVGTYNPGYNVETDAVSLNGTTYNFEMKAVAPADKDECKNGGWQDFKTTFKNQGLCVSWVEHNVLGHGTPAANRP